MKETEEKIKEMQWRCVKCGRNFFFARTSVKTQLKKGSPGFYVACPKCGAHNPISRMEKSEQAKKEVETIFPKEERNRIVFDEIEKRESKEVEKKIVEEEEIFTRDKTLEDSRETYVYEEPKIEFGGKEYTEVELVETWAIKGINAIKRKRLVEELDFIEDKSLIEGILYRFDKYDEIKNDPRLLFDTILKYVPDVNPRKVDEIVDSVIDVNMQYGYIVDRMMGYHPYN